MKSAIGDQESLFFSLVQYYGRTGESSFLGKGSLSFQTLQVWFGMLLGFPEGWPVPFSVCIICIVSCIITNIGYIIAIQ